MQINEGRIIDLPELNNDSVHWQDAQGRFAGELDAAPGHDHLFQKTITRLRYTSHSLAGVFIFIEGAELKWALVDFC